MRNETQYKNVTSNVRPLRYAMLIDENEKQNWKAYIEGALEAFTRVWGGQSFMIIPTNGHTIDERFWSLLEIYSPDILCKYVPTIADLKIVNKAKYTSLKSEAKKAWRLDDTDFYAHWKSSIKDSTLAENLDISKDLQLELVNRLNPFFLDDYVVNTGIRKDTSPGFPATRVTDIVKNSNKYPKIAITVPMKLSNRSYDLYAKSLAGTVSEEYREELNEKGITSLSLPRPTMDFSAKNYLEALIKDDYSPDWHITLEEPSSANMPHPKFIEFLPKRLSSLHLSNYYDALKHREWQEPVTVVIGDTLEDFCLYYNISRIHDNIFWQPNRYTATAYKKAMLNATESVMQKFSESERMAMSLINTYWSLIQRGLSEKFINLTSYSLGNRELETRKQWMKNLIPFHNEQVDLKIKVVNSKNLKYDCFYRLSETNNHTVQQDMIFNKNRSVGRLQTPIPKNFKRVDPSVHRWITSCHIAGYSPPRLPGLVKDIVKLHFDSTHDMRIAKDGIAFVCPNIGFFGGDIDTNLIKPAFCTPSPEEIFSKYFQENGYKIQLSDKGNYLQDTIQRFGSLEKCASFFRSEVNRVILDHFIKEIRDDSDHEVIYLSPERRAFLSFNAFSRRFSTRSEAVALVEWLVEREILNRGYIFQCERCKHAGWYSISMISKSFKCKRCALMQVYTKKHWKEPDEPRWYYQLAETVYLTYLTHSDITVLALDILRKQSHSSFMYVGETEIISLLNPASRIEIDLLAIVDGDIVLGEAKSALHSAQDLAKYVPLLKSLNVRPSSFVYATSLSSTTKSINTVLARMGHHKILTASDIFS